MSERINVVNIAKACLGTKEHTDRHRTILKIYNDYVKKYGMYQVKEKDAWCATFVSAVLITAKINDIPFECSCARMLNKARVMGIWVERDDYIPIMGDIIMYDWQDNGKGDNIGTPDHVGIVEAVQGKNIIVIEGNKNNAVERRNIPINGKFIRGYITPRYK